METICRNTPCGNIEGIREDGVCKFLGIPYAAAKRFEYPIKNTGWSGTLKATSYGPSPIQKRAFTEQAAINKSDHFEKEFFEGVESTYSEDCLNLNIWTPNEAKDCPVLVVIYGGGLETGQNHSLELDGTTLAKEGIITVIMNYRVNVFGFMAMKELEDESGCCGNYGYYDQQTAISWIKDNIHAFGGNPGNMTLIGQSAGAASCETQIKSPLNKGLFRNAIIQSSAGFATFIKQKKDNGKEYAKWEKVYKKTGCQNVSELKKMPARNLLDAYYSVANDNPIGFCSAVYDKNFTGKSKNLPTEVNIMCSFTANDVFPLVLYFMSEFLAWSQKKAGKDTYSYYFKRQLPGDDKGAWHGSDLMYIYGLLGNSWRPYTSEDYELSKTMRRYFINFIKNGNPNGDGLQEWKPLNTSKKYMQFDTGACGMGKVSLMEVIKNTLHPTLTM